jgi:hypothetical protein
MQRARDTMCAGLPTVWIFMTVRDGLPTVDIYEMDGIVKSKATNLEQNRA